MALLLAMTYAAIIFVCFRFFRLPVNKWSVATAVIGGFFIVGGLFLGMAYCHPFTSEARIYFQTTPIVPQVRGKVVAVHAKPNMPLKAGDPLFSIDPTPYRAQVDDLEAQLAFARRRLAESMELARHSAGSKYDVEQYQKDVKALTAQLEKARFDLESTTVLAPTDGWVTQVRLRPGMMAAPLPLSPVMTFVHSENPILVGAFRQNPLQNIKPGEPAEVIFPALPGRCFKGRVTTVMEALAEGQLQPSGNLLSVQPNSPEGRVPVFIEITDDLSPWNLPLGSAAAVAVYSDSLKSLGPIRQILLRMASWRNIVCLESL